MDGQRFDALTRTLEAGSPRRAELRSIAGGAAGTRHAKVVRQRRESR
jgi:hypothetical protein